MNRGRTGPTGMVSREKRLPHAIPPCVDYGRRMGLRVVGPEPIPFPMRFMKVEGELSSSGGGSLSVEQVYQNTTGGQAELEFLFDAPGLSIAAFTAIVDGKTLRGEIKEKEAAADDYDDAIASGCRGALVEKKETPEGEVFSLSMGSLKPGASITVQLRIVAKMESLCGISGNTTTLTLPITACGHFLPPPASPSPSDPNPSPLPEFFINTPNPNHAVKRRGPPQTTRGPVTRKPPSPPAPVPVPAPVSAPAPVKWEGPEGMEVCLAIECSGKIESASCPSHPLLNSQFSGGRLFVTTQDPLALSRSTSPSPLRIDVVTTDAPASAASLSVLPDPAATPAAATAPAPSTEEAPKEGEESPKGEGKEGRRPEVGWSYLPKASEVGKYAVTATFRPTIVPLDAEPEDSWMGREILFIVDRSGSMRGEKIEQVRGALQLFLRSIPEGCTFNILGFGTRFDSAFSCYQPYTPDTLETASHWVKRMQADLGGTDILTPLTNMLPRPEAKMGETRLPREVFVLTDGDVRGKQEVIQFVRNNTSHDTRLWALGIGAEANTRLVTGMAIAGNGAADFTKPGDRVQPKVLAQLDRALKPALTALTVDWGDLKVADRMGAEGKGVKEGYPMGPLFEGQVATVQAILTGLPSKASTITLTGLRGSEPFVCKVEVSPGEIQATPAPHLLCAQRAISHLERLVSKGQRGAEQAALKSTGSSISRAFGLVSAFTSYVAVEDSPSLQVDATQGPSTKYSANTGFQPAPARETNPNRPSSGARGRGAGMPRNSRDGMMVKRCKAASGTFNALSAPAPAAPFPCTGAVAKPQRESARSMDVSDGECELDALKGRVPEMAMPQRFQRKEVENEEKLTKGDSQMRQQRQSSLFSASAGCTLLASTSTARPVERSARLRANLQQSAGAGQDGSTSLEVLVTHQRVDGAFVLQDPALSAMGLYNRGVEEEVSKWGDRVDAACTAIVLAYLHAKLGDQAIEWKLIANKARRFISKILSKAQPIEINGTTIDSADQAVEYFTKLFFS